MYISKNDHAKNTKDIVEQEGAECHLFPGDISNRAFAKKVVTEAINKYSSING
jgi:hypothetical protein